MREINVGNDHQVAFVPDIDYIDFERLGSRLEKSTRFPNGINTEFCEIVAKNHLKVRVFERGVGETLACGTGACAAAICAIANGFCEASKRITVEMKGGNLTVFCDEMQRIWLSGNAQRVFEGIIEI